MVLSQFRGPVTKLMEPVYIFINKLGIHPNTITIAGLGLGIIAGWAFASGEYMAAAISIALSGFLDMLDGGVARVGGYVSDEGAFLDSIADRLGESAIYVGVVLNFTNVYQQLIGLSLLVVSYSVSYLRARGEGLGVSLSGIGVMERSERMMAIFFAALLASIYGVKILVICLSIILIMVGITVVHRFIRVYEALKISAVES